MSAAPIIIAGSWEDRLRQAQRMADNHDEQAIPTLRSLIDRLNRFSPAQLKTGASSLFWVRQQAAHSLEFVHLARGELAIATEVRKEILSWGKIAKNAEDDLGYERLPSMLALQRRYDEALDYAHALMREGLDVSENLVSIALLAIRQGDAEPAESILAKIERDANREPDADRRTEKRAELAWCRSRLCLLRRQWDEAHAWFDHASALNPSVRDNLVILYDPLVRNGEAERALLLIDQETKHPMRVALWRGLALRSVGKEDAARAVWGNAQAADLSGYRSNPGVFEWIYCHYYLGEPAGLGYAFSLQIVQSDPKISWFANCATALGASIRNDKPGALLHMNIALEKLRVSLSGVHFYEEIRYHFANLLTPEQMTPLLHYFHPVTASDDKEENR